MAAVLACRDGAVLSHLSAAVLWDLLPGSGFPAHVTVAGSAGRKRSGLVVHRSVTMTAAAVIVRDAIPATTPARTLADLRPLLPREGWSNVVRRARALGYDVGAVLPEPTRSELERIFLRLCCHRGIPNPEVNVRVGHFEVDLLWREEGLVVETDGYSHHRSRAAFEADRARDARLTVLGLEVLRFTYRQVTGDSARVAATVEAVRARRARSHRPGPAGGSVSGARS